MGGCAAKRWVAELCRTTWSLVAAGSSWVTRPETQLPHSCQIEPGHMARRPVDSWMPDPARSHGQAPRFIEPAKAGQLEWPGAQAIRGCQIQPKRTARHPSRSWLPGLVPLDHGRQWLGKRRHLYWLRLAQLGGELLRDLPVQLRGAGMGRRCAVSKSESAVARLKNVRDELAW